jgi:hypothetical protein
MALVVVNPRKPAQAHAEISSICLSEAMTAVGPRRVELLESARLHIREFRYLLTAQCPEEAWITYNELVDLLERFDNPDQVPATGL